MVYFTPKFHPSVFSQVSVILCFFLIRPAAFSDLKCHPYIFLLIVSHSLNFGIPHHLSYFIYFHAVVFSAEWQLSLIGYIRD